MRIWFTFALLSIALVAQVGAQVPEASFLRSAGELEWRAVEAPQEGMEALLWGEPGTGEHATMVRWRFNSKLPAQVLQHDLHLVVLAGTLSVEADGEYREVGPGGFARVPRGTEHVLGCEATGQCTFLRHHGSGAAPSSASP